MAAYDATGTDEAQALINVLGRLAYLRTQEPKLPAESIVDLAVAVTTEMNTAAMSANRYLLASTIVTGIALAATGHA